MLNLSGLHRLPIIIANVETTGLSRALYKQPGAERVILHSK